MSSHGAGGPAEGRMRAADHYMPAGTTTPRPPPFSWKFTRTDLGQLLTRSPGTTPGNAPAPGSMMIPDELTGATT
jgi:hypothetical protein